MSEERKTIHLCLAHMSEEGWEQKYVKEAFDTNWVVPMGRYNLRGQARIESYEQMLELIDLAKKEGFFD
ncbi:MAG: hypothetical protein ACI3ZG_00325 [Candidatus Coprenecus sp.]